MATKARKGLNRLIIAIGTVNALLWVFLFVVVVEEVDTFLVALIIMGFALPFCLFRLLEWAWEGFFEG